LDSLMKTHPCRVEIRTRFLEDNFKFLLELAAPHAELMAVVKGDAYGHSLELCAPAAVRAGARWLSVATVEEGVAARVLCPEAGVLVLCGAFPGQGAAVVEHRLSAAAWQPWQLDELEGAARAAGKTVSVHVEIDTGMSRQGVSLDGLLSLLERFHAGSPLKLEGVMTHLLAADEADGRATETQLVLLEKMLSRMEASGLHPEWLHAGSSATLLAGDAARIAVLGTHYGMKTMLRTALQPGFQDGDTAVPYLCARAIASGADVEDARDGRARGSRWRGGGLQRHLCCDRADAAGAGGRGLRRRPKPSARQPFQLAGPGPTSAAGRPRQYGHGGGGRD